MYKYKSYIWKEKINRDVAIWEDFMEKTKLNSRIDRGI